MKGQTSIFGIAAVVLVGLIIFICSLFAPITVSAQVTYPNRGGTGTSTIPSYGQVLVGNSSGTYSPTATSSLGIESGSSLSFTYPLVNLADVVSLAFGTTTANTWSLHNIFASLFATIASTTHSTTTSFGINNETFTDLTGIGLQNVVGALTLNTTGDWTGTFDGLEGIYYLANAFSTTSADYWKTQRDLFSTTSADYHFGTKSIQDLSDVASFSEAYGDLLGWNGSEWNGFATSSLGLPTFADLASDSDFIFETNYNSLMAATSSILWAKTGIFASTTSTFENLVLQAQGSAPAFFDTSNLTESRVFEYPNTSGTLCLVGQACDGSGTVTQVNTTYPIGGGPITTTGTLSLAFGTTTQNTWVHQIFSSLFATNASTTNATTTNLHVSGSIQAPGLPSSLIVTDGNGVFEQYEANFCANQFIRALSALGIPTCESVNLIADTIGTLTVARGGTGTTTAPAGQILYGGGNGTYQSQGTTTVSCSGSISCTSFTTIGSAPITITGTDTTNSKWATSTNNLLSINPNGGNNIGVGVGTSTPAWTLQVASSTRPQLALSDGSVTSDHWTVRNTNGNFYIASASPTTFATSSLPAFEISSIGFGTTTIRGGLNIDGFATTTSDVGFNISSGCYAINNVCVGGGGSGTPGGNDGELQYNNGGSFGGLTGTKWDQAGFLGLGTTSPWGALSIASSTWSDFTRPLFVVATTSDLTGQLFSIFATTTAPEAPNPNLLPMSGARIAAGLLNYFGYGLMETLTVAGWINQTDSQEFCDLGYTGDAVTSISNEGIGCNGFGFFKDNNATFQPVVDGTTNGVIYGQLSTTAVNDGAGLFLGYNSNNFLRIASNTPRIEVNASIGTIQSATTTAFYIGFTDVTPGSTAYETPPTQGCYFTASTTQANWQAVTRNGVTTQQTDTGVASSTVITGNGGFRMFKLTTSRDRCSYFIRQSETTSLIKVAEHTTSVPNTTALNAGLYFSDVTQGAGATFRFYRLRVFWRSLLAPST